MKPVHWWLLIVSVGVEAQRELKLVTIGSDNPQTLVDYFVYHPSVGLP